MAVSFGDLRKFGSVLINQQICTLEISCFSFQSLSTTTKQRSCSDSVNRRECRSRSRRMTRDFQSTAFRPS